jgi:hypothetical protein
MVLTYVQEFEYLLQWNEKDYNIAFLFKFQVNNKTSTHL